jgi:hypothetical protein
MAALTADTFLKSRKPDVIGYKIADNVKIYKGSIVCRDTSGYANVGADTANFAFLGIAEEDVDNTTSGHTAGRYWIRVRSGEVFTLPTSGAAQSWVGTNIYVTDSGTVSNSSTNFIQVGVCTRYNSATSIDVFVPHVPSWAQEAKNFSSPQTITSANANALAVGANGTTNPVFNVDSSTASVATGINVKGAAAGGNVAITVTSSQANEGITENAKGSGQFIIANTSTGLVSIGRGPASPPIFNSTKTVLNSQNVTPTAAQLIGGVVEHVTQTGGGTFTLDTAANIDTAIPGAVNGDTFDCVVANTGTQTSTITTNTGLTLKGTVAIASGKNGYLTFFKTGAGAWTVYCTASN